MIETAVVMGKRIGPFDGCLDAEAVTHYNAATMDASTLPPSSGAVPVTAIVTQIWDAVEAAREELIDPGVQPSASGGVQGKHDIVLHRPIRPGERLRTWVEAAGAHPGGRHLLTTMRYLTLDDHDELIAEQWWTTVYLNTTCAPIGEPAPDHRFDDAYRARPVASRTITTDLDLPRRYAEVSGDWSDHHFTVAAAQRSGADRPFLHGMCTMALVVRGVVDSVADGDPNRVRRVAVRFATPAFPGEAIEVGVFDAGNNAYAFEAASAGSLVISHGRVELRD